jgi:phosphatidylserine decarboxylase
VHDWDDSTRFGGVNVFVAVPCADHARIADKKPVSFLSPTEST